MLHRRHLRDRQKGGRAVGKTKRGKGTKIMAVADRSGLPIAIYLESASPHEVTLVEATIASRFVAAKPQRLIGDRAYDSDPLDAKLRVEGIELIAPHRRNRVKPKTQDGRKLRRYKRRWKIERLNAWLQNYRRVLVRYERKVENFLGLVQLVCILILLKAFLR
jgi:transposase